LAAEPGVVAELSEGLATAPLLVVAEPLLSGLVAPLGPIVLLALPAVAPLAPELWANAIGAKAAIDSARPAPSR
jgi:hypothetical protein